MERIFSGSFTLALFTVAFALPCCTGREDESLQQPSEVKSRIVDSVMAMFDRGEIKEIDEMEAARRKIAESMIEKVKSKGLDRGEMLNYGKLLGWVGLQNRAKALYEELRLGDDPEGRKAWVNLINMEINDEKYRIAEEMISDFRRKWTPVPDELYYLSVPVSNLARRYNEMNEPEAAVRVYTDELSTLPFDAPYRSFGLAEGLTSMLIEMDRVPECRSMLERFAANLKEGLDRHIKGIVYDDTTKQKDDPVVQKYQNHIDTYGILIKRLDLVSKKAPSFRFLHVYNADSSFTLEELLGRVVVLDFWTTWCLPCLEGYKELRKIYTDFHDAGLEIVGLTSFQGIYRDLDTGEVEGSGEEDLDREREIELTGSFIEKHQMHWPCAFSDRSVFDPEYTVRGVPTFVILDREGNVRFIHAGIGSGQQMRRITAKLIE